MVVDCVAAGNAELYLIYPQCSCSGFGGMDMDPSSYSAEVKLVSLNLKSPDWKLLRFLLNVNVFIMFLYPLTHKPVGYFF